MLGFLFGLNARIGRLHYFLATLLLAAVMAAVVFAMVFGGLLRSPRSGSLDLTSWPVMGAGAFFAFCTITLQCMRIRDIGWDPVVVVAAWIAIAIIDALVAGRFPAWSLEGDHHGTIVGSLVNLALYAALLFWPSGEAIDWSPPFRDDRRQPNEPAPRQSASSAPADRIARATRTEFGRR